MELTSFFQSCNFVQRELLSFPGSGCPSHLCFNNITHLCSVLSAHLVHHTLARSPSIILPSSCPLVTSMFGLFFFFLFDLLARVQPPLLSKDDQVGAKRKERRFSIKPHSVRRSAHRLHGDIQNARWSSREQYVELRSSPRSRSSEECKTKRHGVGELAKWSHPVRSCSGESRERNTRNDSHVESAQ